MTSSIPSTIRLSIASSFFNASPVRAIKQLIGPNATLISYTVSSILTPSDELIVDATYRSLPITPFSIHYIPLSSIKHLIPNSEKYVATVDSLTVKLNNPKLSDFHDYLPVRIKRTIINTTDVYESYYTTDNSTFTLNENATIPIAYFATTVVNPLNSLITPIHSHSTSFTVPTPEKLYPPSFNPPKSRYTIDDTINNYKQTVSTIPMLSNISSITHSSTFPTSSSSSLPTTAYIIPTSSLPSTSTHGIILIQPKRIPDLILYYPTNNFTLSAEELASIKSFIEADIINYNNYYYLKNK